MHEIITHLYIAIIGQKKCAPDLADQIATVINNNKVMGTKKHYASQLRHYVNFCLDHGHDPFAFPLDPNLCMFWIQQKVNMHGNIKSIRTWTAMLNWISDLSEKEKLYTTNPVYTSYLAGLRKQHHEGQDHRLPFRLKHIKDYTDHVWKASSTNSKCMLHKPLKSNIINLYSHVRP